MLGLGAEQLGDVPRVDLVGLGGQQIGLLGRRVRGVPAPFADLVVGAQHPVHRGHRSQVDAVTEELGVDGDRRLVMWSSLLSTARRSLRSTSLSARGCGVGIRSGFSGRGLRRCRRYQRGLGLTRRRTRRSRPDHMLELGPLTTSERYERGHTPAPIAA